MVTTREIVWLAGLLEGEGCFSWDRSKHAPLIQLGMTDRDVVERVAALFDVKVHDRSRGQHKLVSTASTTGSRAAGWMMTLYPLMGIRRRAKIAESLQRWRAVRANPKVHTVFEAPSIAEGRACTHCQRLLTFGSFPFASKRKGLRRHYCRECAVRYNRIQHMLHPPRHHRRVS